MRAFRPSWFGSTDDDSVTGQVEEQSRSAKVQVYARRAEAKLPLFPDDEPQPGEPEPEA